MFQEIPIAQLRFTQRNPRSNPEEDLEELAASIGDEDNPRLAQFPLVEQTGPDTYRVIAGERRIRAAARRGWQNMPCVVAPPLDPMEVHALRLAENLHRKNLHPLDEAAGLKIAWFSANAEALGGGNEARAILDSDLPNPQTLDALQAILSEHGFTPNAPAVPWEVLLDQLGVSMHPEKRKKLLAVLTVEPSVQAAVKTLDVSEAGLRAIGRLEPEAQQRLVDEIAASPDLAHKVRRIARIVNDGTHTLDQALAEARGELPPELQAEMQAELQVSVEQGVAAPSGAQEPGDDQRQADAVMRCLELATQMDAACGALAALGHPASFAPPWNEAAADALALLRQALARFDGSEEKTP